MHKRRHPVETGFSGSTLRGEVWPFVGSGSLWAERARRLPPNEFHPHRGFPVCANGTITCVGSALRALGLSAIGVLALIAPNPPGVALVAPNVLVGIFLSVHALKSGAHAALVVDAAVALHLRSAYGESPLK